MKQKSILFLLLFLFSSAVSHAQRKVYEHLNFNVGAKKDAFFSSVCYTQSINLFKKETIWFGTGLRLFNFNTKKYVYDNTNASTTSLAFVEPSSVNVTSLNIPIHVDISAPKRRFFAGFSLDLIGFAIGKTQKIPISSLGDSPIDSLSFKPRSPNLFGASNHRGTHASSVYIGYQPLPELAFRVGLNRISSELKETDKENYYKTKTLLPFFSICFNFER